MRVVVVIQARVGSSRLPGKVLLTIGDRSMLAHVVGRCRASRSVDAVVVATTTEAGDDALVDACAVLGVDVVRGPRDDVLERYRLACVASAAELVVRVTADCPLLESAEIDRLVDHWHREAGAGRRLDWLSNQFGEQRRIPRGLDVEVVAVDALVRAAAHAVDPAEREHVTPWLYRDGVRSALAVSDPPGPDRSALRLTVDDANDLALVRAVVDRLGADCAIDAVAALLAAEPSLAALNAGVQQKAVLSEAQLRAARVAGRLLVGRADASPRVGVGHVARVFTVLEAWREAGGQACLVGDGIHGTFVHRLAAAGIEQRAVVDGGVDAAIWAAAVACVVDGYAFDPADIAALKVAVAGPLCAIDDVGGALTAADLLVHQGSVTRAAQLYGNRAGAAGGGVLAGPAYLLLRAELRDAMATPDQAEPGAADGGVERVVVTLGGADVGGWTLPVATALLAATAARREVAAEPALDVDVVVGPAAPPTLVAALEAASAAHAGAATLRIHRDVREMAGLLGGATVVVSAAGSTAWELAGLGVPAVLFVVAENQRGVAAVVVDAGCAVEATDATQAAARTVALLADPSRRTAMAKAGRALVDGRGVYRVLDALLSQIERHHRTQGASR